MQPIKITIENYRNIPLGHPIQIEIKDGVSFILGMNNVGKSTVLKFFYEMRNVLATAAQYRNSNNARNVVLNGNIFFDQVVNRGFPNNPITVTIDSEGQSIVLVIDSQGNEKHTNTLHVSQTYSGPSTGYDGGAVSSFMKSIYEISDTLYFGSFRGIDVNVTGSTYDLDIGQNFVSLWNTWSTGGTVLQNQKTDELVEELKKLLGFERFVIRVSEDRKTLKITTDDGTFSLDEIGSGISQFIIVLGNALIKNKSFILIDEPEIGLHPRLQEVFVRALAAKVKRGLIASSHSIGLARSTYDAQILSLTRLPAGHFQLKPFGEHYTPTISQSINELGYSQFSEIGGNNILLVEGRTDIKVFREVLRKFGIETNFIIVSLGGSEFIGAEEAKIKDELNELKRLNAKSYSIIFDSEKKAQSAVLEKRFIDFKACCETLGFEVFPTDYHSTENYISQTALDKVFGVGQYRALTPFENFNDDPKNKWAKEKNWRMFREMSKQDLSPDLVQFIEEKLLPFSKL